MRKMIIALISLMFWISACEPGLVVVTPTPEMDYKTPAPTANPGWRADCLDDGVFPLNPNPCPSDFSNMEFIVRPNGNWGDNTTDINCDGEWCIIDLHGGSGFAGAVGATIHNIPLSAGTTYAINFNGWVDLTDGDAKDNYSAQLRIYTDSGDIITLRSHSVERYNPQTRGWEFTGYRPFFWCVSSYSSQTIAFEATLNAVWAMSHPGNNFRLDAIYIYEVTNLNVCNEVIGIG